MIWSLFVKVLINFSSLNPKTIFLHSKENVCPDPVVFIMKQLPKQNPLKISLATSSWDCNGACVNSTCTWSKQRLFCFYNWQLIHTHIGQVCPNLPLNVGPVHSRAILRNRTLNLYPLHPPFLCSYVHKWVVFNVTSLSSDMKRGGSCTWRPWLSGSSVLFENKWAHWGPIGGYQDMGYLGGKLTGHGILILKK